MSLMTTARPDTPYHLLPLTQGTPLSLEKLKAAWPGLSLADKVILLNILLGELGNREGSGVLKWKRHRNFVKTLGLGDENEYIRHLTALRVSSDDKDEESIALYERVIKDPSSLVVSTQDHWSLSAFMFPSKQEDGIARFWRVSGPRRLAIAAELLDSHLAACLKYGATELLPKSTITSGDLEDLVHEYLGNRSSNKIRHVEELWRIVPDLPLTLSLVMVDSLPPFLRKEIPRDLLARFTDDHLQVLLAREDINLLDLRRNVFQSASTRGLMHAAVSSPNFAILDSDISELFTDPENAADRAVALAQSAKGATLVQKQALRWFVDRFKLGNMWVQYYAEQHLTARCATLSGKALESEVLQMRLFEFARVLTVISADGLEAVRSQYSGDWDYLQKRAHEYMKLIVEGNPWETYLRLRQQTRDLNALRGVLPSADDERHLDPKKLPPDLQA